MGNQVSDSPEIPDGVCVGGGRGGLGGRGGNQTAPASLREQDCGTVRSTVVCKLRL